jgi:hypothetical protein
MYCLMFRLVIVFGLVTVSGGAVVAQETKVQKAPKAPRIREIVVRGRMGVSSDAIVSACGLKLGERATPRALETAKLVLLNSYLVPDSASELLSKIIRFRLETIAGSPAETRVVIDLDSKKRPTDSGEELLGIVINGSAPLTPAEVMAVMQVRPGERLRVEILRLDVERINRLYDRTGYIASVMDSGFGMRFGILSIPIKVSKIAKIELRGLGKTPEKLVRDTMKLRVGSYYNVNDLKRDSDALSVTGRFKDVQTAILTPAPGDVNLVLTFTEKM